MLVGALRERVTIQSATLQQDSYGEPIATWSNLVTTPTVWANIRSKAGGERFVSGGEQVIAQLIHTVTIRHRTDVTVKMRLLEGSRVFLIENMYDPTGRNEYIALECTEVQF
jgi:SPP1 family predicted phage head-tail adaptor